LAQDILRSRLVVGSSGAGPFLQQPGAAPLQRDDLPRDSTSASLTPARRWLACRTARIVSSTTT
jgi:hypothetical protein